MVYRLCIALILTFSLLSLSGQRMSREYVDAPLSEILDDIKSDLDIKLAYDARTMRDIIITVQLVDLPVEEALERALRATDYEPILIKNTWLIIPRENKIPKIRTTYKRDFKVSGRLIDASSGEALAYANIALAGRAGGSVSNLDGYFNLPDVKIDTIPLCISYVGYRTRCIDLSQHETENMLIKLDRADTYLKVIEIQDEQKSDLDYQPVAGLVRLEAATLSRLSAGPQPDLFRAVQSLAGVSSSDGLDAHLHIRGGDADENLVLWDGFTLYHLDHFFGAFSTLNPSVIQQVTLHKDPYSSRFGGRSGGVLDIIGKQGDRKQRRARLDMNLINMGILTEGPLSEKSSYLVSFRRSHTDFIQSGIYKDILDRVFAQSVSNDSESLVSKDVDSDYFYHDFNLKWGYDLNKKDKISLTLFRGKDSFVRTFDTRNEPQGSPFVYETREIDDSDWGNTGLGLVWSRNPDAGRYSRTSLGWSSYRSNYYFSDESFNFFNGQALPPTFSSSRQVNVLRDLSFDHRRERTLQQGKLHYGYQFKRLELTGEFTLRDSLQQVTQFSRIENIAYLNSLYADRFLTLKDKLTLRAGARISYNNYINQINVEPRLRIHYQLREKLGVHLATGYYIQQIRRPTEQNLFKRQADRWELSEGDVIPESIDWHSAAGLTWSYGPFEFAAELFYKQLDGVIFNQEQNRLLSAYTQELETIVNGKGTAAGLDLTLQYDYRAHSAWISYSYTKSENEIAEVNDGRTFPSPYNKPHDFKLNHNYRYRAYLIHTALIASSGYPYTPVLGFFDGPSGDTFLVYGDDLSARLPSLFRIDLSVNRRFTYKNYDLELGIGVYNLTDYTNVNSRSYTIPLEGQDLPDNLRINSIDLELIGISPTFSLTLDLK